MGEIRPATGRSALKKTCWQEKCPLATSKQMVKTDGIVIDGYAMLWSSSHWLFDGKVEDLVVAVVSYVTARLEKSYVYLTFDRYEEMNTN